MHITARTLRITATSLATCAALTGTTVQAQPIVDLEQCQELLTIDQTLLRPEVQAACIAIFSDAGMSAEMAAMQDLVPGDTAGDGTAVVDAEVENPAGDGSIVDAEAGAIGDDGELLDVDADVADGGVADVEADVGSDGVTADVDAAGQDAVTAGVADDGTAVDAEGNPLVAAELLGEDDAEGTVADATANDDGVDVGVGGEDGVSVSAP